MCGFYQKSPLRNTWNCGSSTAKDDVLCPHSKVHTWASSVQRQSSDLQSTVSTSDPWQAGSAFSAGALVEVQRNGSSVSISGIWQMQNCFSILHCPKCLQMTSTFWSICWLSRFRWFSLLCFAKILSLVFLLWAHSCYYRHVWGDEQMCLKWLRRQAKPGGKSETKKNDDFVKKGTKKITLKAQLNHNCKIYSGNDSWSKSKQSSIILGSFLESSYKQYRTKNFFSFSCYAWCMYMT